MRILALRGENLASLEHFDIDFAADPLDSAGLFAITGPTGAGKSTLLDAMSLALFDTIPRLENATKVEIGADAATIRQDDARTILRHGATAAFAECDFLARDGHRYRARWEVSRARTGTLKQRQMSVTDLDTGEGGTGKLGEIKERIAAIVGLSAEQFGRAVVLSQGEFEAFIKAGPDERSELLEKLTGTEIYSRIGRLAGAKANALRADERDYQARLKSLDGLSDEDRAALDAEHEAAVALLSQQGDAIGVLEKAQAREQRGADLAIKVAGAGTALVAAQAASDGAAPRREALERQRKAAKLVPAWNVMIAAQQQASEAAQRAIEAEGAVAPAQGTLNAGEAAATEADAHFAKADAVLQAARPTLAKARELDTRIAAVDLRIATIGEERTKLSQALPDLASARDTAASALLDAETSLAEHHAWLGDHEPFRFVAQREGDLLADLAALTSLGRKIEIAQADHVAQLAHGEDAERADADARKARDAAAHSLNEAKSRADAAQAAMPSSEVREQAAVRRDALAALTPLITGVGLAIENRTAQASTVATLAQRHAAVSEDLGKTGHAHAAIVAKLPVLEAEAKGARTAAERALAAEGDDAKRLRAALVPGDPCPVCGSASHDLALLEAALAAPALEAKVAAEELDTRHTEASQEERALAERSAYLTVRRDELAGELQTAQTRFADLDETSRDALSAMHTAARACDLDPEADDFAQSATDAGQHADRIIAEHARLRDARDAAQAALNTARTAFDTTRTAAELAAKAQDAATRAAQDAKRLTDELARDRKSLTAALDKQFASLPDTGGDWQALSDPAKWLSALATQWRARETARSNTHDALPALREGRDQAASLHGQAETRARQLDADVSGETETLALLKAERGTLLPGETVDVCESRLTATFKAKETARDEVRKALAKAREGLTAARTVATAAAQESERTKALSEQAASQFAALLAPSGLNVEAIAEAAGRMKSFEAEEAALQTLRDALTRAQETLTQRRADLDIHSASDAPGPIGEDLTEALAKARPALAEAEEAVQTLVSRIYFDDVQRDKTADLRAEIEAWKERSHVWLALGDMIGDADGRKFRKFAQSLTLDRLLEAANARLGELKPRYMLERASGGDMAIQVIDNDMAGEVRGLHNLSGGERFLVSLALALGLAEMSTGRGIRIESLFIDEGFGALDPASLGQALAVLEQLHATGRRVGVISHVEELKERIPVKIEVTPVSRGKSEVAVSVG